VHTLGLRLYKWKESLSNLIERLSKYRLSILLSHSLHGGAYIAAVLVLTTLFRSQLPCSRSHANARAFSLSLFLSLSHSLSLSRSLSLSLSLSLSQKTLSAGEQQRLEKEEKNRAMKEKIR